jgi:DNA processing protein
MSMYGLPTATVVDLVTAVRGHQADDGLAAEAFARMAWTVLIEPGDQIAGQIIGTIGAGRALEAVIAGDTAELAGIWRADGHEPARADRVVADAFDRWRPRLAARPVVRAIEHAARLGLTVVLPGDPDWPAGFDDLGPAAPIAVWLRGDRRRLEVLADSIAFVGARAASGYGEFVATELAGGVAERGVTIVSGGAYGIDAAAHRAALAADGVTAAFLAGGLDRTYPAGNSDLLERVAATGLLLAEVPPGTPPTRVRFLTRNRLLAASSRATIVVEAGMRSGSLNTAHHALAIGRPVGAVPGPITSVMSAGCHRLLREEDATCVTSADDVMELAGGARVDQTAGYEATDPDVVRVLDALSSRRPRSADELARSSGMAVTAVLGVLGTLDATGSVRRGEAGWLRISLKEPTEPPERDERG